MKRIYLDNNATTVLDPRVLKAMLQDLEGPPYNPSSIHYFGKTAKSLIQKARLTLATYFQKKPEEVIFTSGGTESANHFIRTIPPKSHVISSPIEHSCIYKTLQSSNLDVTYVPVNSWGAPLPEQIIKAIRPDTKAIILSAANSETGVKIDLETMASIAHKHQIPLFIDAVGFIGKEPWVCYPGVTAIAISGHKFHAPKGSGALIIDRSYKLGALLTGGNQEYQRRAGTENVAGILGLAEAIAILKENQLQITNHLLDLKLFFEESLARQIPSLIINGEGPRIANTSNLAFPGVDGETLLIQLDMVGIAASHGSACSSGALEPSRVLTQMGLPKKTTTSSVRFSFSRFNTKEEIEEAVTKISSIVTRMQ